ncbi:MAG TPA: type II toxin-antitoxin system VapC family toxin [Candidatus Nitrosotalea sp.]|nr:type II toxin-antitoxin system VapC family toxin [Candidatus Nitrosotalea sp.]
MVERPRVVYLDSSAIVKLVVREAETGALRTFLGSAELISSVVATVEVPRAAYLKTGDPATIGQAEQVLARFFLVNLDGGIRSLAARVQPAGLPTLNAIHLAAALQVGSRIEAAVIYDQRLADAVRNANVVVHAPS